MVTSVAVTHKWYWTYTHKDCKKPADIYMHKNIYKHCTWWLMWLYLDLRIYVIHWWLPWCRYRMCSLHQWLRWHEEEETASHYHDHHGWHEVKSRQQAPVATVASGKDTASHTSNHHGWHYVQSLQKRRVAAMPLNVIHFCCVVAWHCWYFVVNLVLF